MSDAQSVLATAIYAALAASAEAWSLKAGHQQAQEIAALVRGSLDNQPLTLADGFVLVSLLHTKTRTRREARTDAHVAEMRFRAVTASA